MKKLKYLVFVFLSVLCLTGCGKDKAKDELKDALLKLKDTEAISMKLNLNMGSEEMKMPLSMEMSVKGNNAHMKFGMTVFGTTQEMYEAYMIEKDKELYNYIYDATSGEGKWVYTKTPIMNNGQGSLTDSFGENLDEQKIEEYLDSFESVKKVKSDKDGYQKYELTVSKKSIEEDSKKDVEDEDALKMIDEALKVFPDSLTFNMYLKNGELAIMTADFSNIDFSSIMSENLLGNLSTDEDSDELDQTMEMFKNFKLFDMTIEIVARNEDVKVELPKEVEEKAIQFTDDTSLDNFDM